LILAGTDFGIGGLLALVLVAVELLLVCVVAVELLAPGLALPVVCGVVSHGGGLYAPR
jgi:hypothetical protein